jgi:hypothetical protein
LLSQGGGQGRPYTHSASVPTFVSGTPDDGVIGWSSGAPHGVDPASLRFQVRAFHADHVPLTVIV